MKSLLASTIVAGTFAAALAGAGAQTMPDAQPSPCPSASIANSLVESTLAGNCVTPKPSATPKPVATEKPRTLPQSSPLASPLASPNVEPTSKGVMR